MTDNERLAIVETQVIEIKKDVCKIDELDNKVNGLVTSVAVINEGVNQIKEKLDKTPCEKHSQDLEKQAVAIASIKTRLKILWGISAFIGSTAIGLAVKLIFFV